MLKLVCIGLLGLVNMTGAWAASSEGTKAAAPARKVVAKASVSKPVIPAQKQPVDLSPDLLLISERVVLGAVPCELGAKVVIKQDTSPGRFLLELGRQSFRMEPTFTTTGAIRLEDPISGVVWLQLGNKSMLLNQRLGKRLADSCVNLHQSAVASAMEKTNSPGLLDDVSPAPPR